MVNNNLENRCPDGASENAEEFSGYQWTYYSSLEHGPLRSRADSFLASVSWAALLEYAAEKRNGVSCILFPDIGLGYNHMVRIIQFSDGKQWVARLRLPPLADGDSCEDALETSGIREFSTICLVRQSTHIPVPEVHAIEERSDCKVNAPFMLMDCLKGNVGMDLGMSVPPQYKKAFLRGLARIHVQLSTVLLPKIGTIVSVNADGTYQQGPIPGLGGPFDTATEFYKAWAGNTKFGMTDEQLREVCGPYAAEIIPSVSSFAKSIGELADTLSFRDHGPFPLCHGDFGHNNTIVDDQYHILGVIDWEMAFAGPWEMLGDFPLTLSIIPPAIDAPWNYNEDGSPKSADLIEQFEDQKWYVEAVKQEENSNRGNIHYLSDALGDSRRQQLATAMRMYQDGKIGTYSKIIDKFMA
ncbi:uncharacterized protein TrAtP1_013053 [Trichoderma atroviride]|uniref:Aminoglycoside phosphotransferase domain-containing protein n=1 Tax=Hypocrea atroviridis (strain ATCC 20476 / IMI 206040) TaxID=452589 RepID=G9NTD2_HYPAI|nr:uncharacterized protein TRIATDRAFT_88643 [Trichoderma atroviride IMI 206040]EHK45975.1 hypothetical protein TRIATDRAFT_88643 [Trichoderma atroviride IMI 206040]UKZ72115.1 hypothetical protein TrAtP1_013053 [Trichoderma atroviride]